MFGDGHHDSLVRPGIDEALACQDMLARTPVRPALIIRVLARLGAAVRGLGQRPQPRPKPEVAQRSAP
jgi:hypothetical protein